MESLATSVVVGGRYRLGAVLGEGGMARVFDAFDLRLERAVAVKVLRPEADALPDVQRRFQQEARFTAQIHHPHIVAILDFGEDKGHSYLVMERLSGATLRNEMAAGPLAPQRVVSIASETLAALRAAHRHGVLHRDIKPSNVLLQEDGHTKLTDFGIAKGFSLDPVIAPGTDETMTGVVLGTPGYLAPERAAGLAASVQSDLYSVGAMIVEALTGQRVLPGAPLPADMPPALRFAASCALAVDPRDRFESAEAMLASLPSTPAHSTPVARASGESASAGMAPTAAVGRRTATVASAPVSAGVATASLSTTQAGAGTWRRHRVRAAIALSGVAFCALIASLFVLLEGSAQTTGQAVPNHVPTTKSVVTAPPTTVATTTTTTFATTTTTLAHHGGLLHHLLHDHGHGGHGGGKGAGRGLGLGGTG